MIQFQTRDFLWPLIFLLVGVAAFVALFRLENWTPGITMFYALMGAGAIIAAATFFFRVRTPPGRALVVPSGDKWKTVQSGSFLLSLRNAHLIPITTRIIGVSFSEPKYRWTLDRLPVSVTAKATVVVKCEDSKNLKDVVDNFIEKGETQYYQDVQTTLLGLITTILSEWAYEAVISGQQEFENRITERWLSGSGLHLRVIDLSVGLVDFKEAKLTGIDLEQAELAQAKFKAKIAGDVAKAAEDNAKAERDKKQATHDTEVFAMGLADEKATKAKENALAVLNGEIDIEKKKADREKSKMDTIKAQNELDRERRTAETTTERDVEEIHNQILENRAKKEQEIETKRIALRGEELSMLKENQGGEFRYQLANKGLEELTKQSEFLAKALANAKIIGSVADLPKLQELLRPSLALRELIPELYRLLDGGLVDGVAGFVKSRFRSTKDFHSEDQARDPAPEPSSAAESGDRSGVPPHDNDFKT
jgi:hypothetical protein